MSGNRWLGNSGTLYRRLLTSHMSIAGIAILILVVCLLMNAGLQRQAQRVADIHVPANAMSARLKWAIERSNGNLRQWLLLGEEAYLHQREHLWRSEIEPTVTTLLRLCEGDQLAEVRKMMAQVKSLEASQQSVIHTLRAFAEPHSQRIDRTIGAAGYQSITNGVDNQGSQQGPTHLWNRAIEQLENATEPLARDITTTVERITVEHDGVLRSSTLKVASFTHYGSLALLFAIVAMGTYSWIAASRNAREVVDPIASPARAASRFARTRVRPGPVLRPGLTEVAELASSFDDMARDLNAQTRALEHANQELASYTHVITHDLKPPIINITGHARQIIESLNNAPSRSDRSGESFPGERPGQLSAEISESATYIDQSIKRLNAFLGGLAANSKALFRTVVIDRTDTREITGEVVALFSHRFSDVDFVIDEMPTIQTDPYLFEHTVTNLIDNAVKFLAPDRRGSVRIGAQSGESEVTFYVRDNGRGITQPSTDIYALFRRADDSTEGTGVGLAVVRSMIVKLGGQVWHTPNEQNGVTFHFSLPVPGVG